MKFEGDVSDAAYPNHVFVRLVARKVKFTRVNFHRSFFESCYLRNCIFDSCDFTGCRFVGSNLSGSSFSGCIFDYANFEKTLIESDILNDGCPGLENLKMKFARSLRTNYQQLGDAKAVNRAIAIELEATEAHLHKAWRSKESYYRKKYSGIRRIQLFVEWLKFRTLDLLWGNGESAPKFVRAILVALLVVAAWETSLAKQPYWHSLWETFLVFIGVISVSSYPHPCLIGLLLVKLVAFGFLTAIIVKRFNRR